MGKRGPAKKFPCQIVVRVTEADIGHLAGEAGPNESISDVVRRLIHEDAARKMVSR